MTAWTASELLPRLRDAFASYLCLEPAEIDPDRAIAELGLDSLTAAQLALDIEDRLGVSLFLSDLTGRETLAELAQAVLAEREP
jgi:acyl carrier protein